MCMLCQVLVDASVIRTLARAGHIFAAHQHPPSSCVGGASNCQSYAGIQVCVACPCKVDVFEASFPTMYHMSVFAFRMLFRLVCVLVVWLFMALPITIDVIVYCVSYQTPDPGFWTGSLSGSGQTKMSACGGAGPYTSTRPGSSSWYVD